MDSRLPDVWPGLAKRVRRRIRVRRISRTVTLILVVGIGLGFLAEAFRHAPVASHDAMTVEAVDQMRAEINDLALQAKQHEALAMQWERLESRTAMKRRVMSDPLTELMASRAGTAGVLVAYADDLQRGNSTAQAITQYQRVVDLFGDTPQAAIALKRLREIKTSSSISNDNLYSGVISCFGDLL